MHKKLWLLLGGAAMFVALLFVLKYSSLGDGLVSLASNGGAWLLPIVAIAALLDSINPCAFGILLLTIAFLLSLQKTRSSILKIGGVYILGLLTVYILIGLGILQALHLFNTPHFMAKIGAVLLIALGGINLINEFFPSFPIKLRIPQAAHSKMALLMNKASLPAVFLLIVTTSPSPVRCRTLPATPH